VVRTSDRKSRLSPGGRAVALVSGVATGVLRGMSMPKERASAICSAQSLCTRLRHEGLDDRGLHLVELIEQAAARLQNQAASADYQASRPDISDGSDVPLTKGLLDLEAHILWGYRIQ